MRGTKRFAASDSAPDTNDAIFRSRRVLGGPSLDGFRPETSRTQDIAESPLDMNNAELSRQHVRALNSQFASWVQMQQRNHPDELWEDGVRDYLTHASSIMEKFSDVVSWLRANAFKGGSAATLNKLVTGTLVSENKLSQEKAVFTPTPATKSSDFSSAWASGALPSNQSSGGVLSNAQSSSLFSSSQGSGLFSGTQSSAQNPSSQSLGLFSNQSTPLFSNSQSPGLFLPNPSFGLSSSNQSSGVLSGSQASGPFFKSQSSAAFSNSQSSGVFSNSQTSGIFFNTRSPILFGQNAAAADRPQDDANDGKRDDELPRPGSPSVKKSEEKGIVVVHEVKCKLYVKSSDPSDKDTWKDRGTGQLSIKCIEGIIKGTKESKPTIIIRNEVGKVLLNALLYPGIKTNALKNSLVAIFHTASDDGGDNSQIAARTFLIRTKTEEDRSKLATAIQEHAPAS